MRSLGSSFVLIALVLVQVPFITCHSDCRSDCLPLWAFDGHHCHDAEAVERDHQPGCQACGHTHDDQPKDGEDHGPGDHELVFAAVRPCTCAPAQAWDPQISVAIVVDAISFVAPVVAGSTTETLDTGPPKRYALETVRLLL